MPETHEASYLSIGEVLGLLLEEFPDITISKIRFLESQGLISPERTASGYRKFYDDDVELLRVILTEQREHYLPLRVIKDRLDSGEIDPTGEHLRGDGAATAPSPSPSAAVPPTPAPAPANPAHASSATVADHATDTDAEGVPSASIRSHPASRGGGDDRARRTAPAGDDPPSEAPRLLPGVLLERAELCAMVGITEGELTELEAFGIVGPRAGSTSLYGDDAVAIAKPASEFLRMGVDARHLRGWRTWAEREASLFDQLVLPRYRQRNPQARAEALAQLRRLDELGAALRAALTRQALRHHFES